MRGDEAAKRTSEPLLLSGNDRGMRDRQAERMTEQRGDREPVRDATDEASLGGRGQQVGAPTGRDCEQADQDQRRHQHEQRGGEGLVAPQYAAQLGFGIGDVHGAVIARHALVGGWGASVRFVTPPVFFVILPSFLRPLRLPPPARGRKGGGI